MDSINWVQDGIYQMRSYLQGIKVKFRKVSTILRDKLLIPLLLAGIVLAVFANITTIKTYANPAIYTVQSPNFAVATGSGIDRHVVTTTDGTHLFFYIDSSGNLKFTAQPNLTFAWNTAVTVKTDGVDNTTTQSPFWEGYGTTVNATIDSSNNVYLTYIN